VFPRTPGRQVPQPQRLREHVNQLASEIQREQQPRLLQRLESVMAAGTHQELQPGAVPLTTSPGRPPYRLAPGRRHRTQITHGTGHLAARVPPRSGPTPGPIPHQIQLTAYAVQPAAQEGQLIPPATMRPRLHRADGRHPASGTQASIRSCSYSTSTGCGGKDVRVRCSVPR
jgi:hypothetical protein